MSLGVRGKVIGVGLMLMVGALVGAAPSIAADTAAPAAPVQIDSKTPVQLGDGPDGIVKDGKPVSDGWESLFDGKNLDRWIYEPGYWEIKNGAIVGTSKGNPHHHYMYSNLDYSDFLLHIDCKLVGYNSGVCIRIAPETFDSAPGYQVDMGDGFWGCLWEEHRRERKIFEYPTDMVNKILHKDDWNHYFVRAEGHHIVMYLNGVKTVDGVDPGGLLSGPIGFQLCHAKPEVASFRNIYIKLLKPATKSTAPKVPEHVVN